MNRWRLRWTRRAERGYRSLSPDRKRMVVDLLDDLQTDPHPPEAEPLKLGRELAGSYKVKINGWRVVYRLRNEDHVIVILTIGQRDENTYLNL